MRRVLQLSNFDWVVGGFDVAAMGRWRRDPCVLRSGYAGPRAVHGVVARSWTERGAGGSREMTSHLTHRRMRSAVMAVAQKSQSSHFCM